MLQWGITIMARSGPHQTSPHHVESANVRQQDELHDLEREKDLDNHQEGSLQTLHTGGNGYQRKGHAVFCMSKVMKKLCNEKLMI